MSPTPKSARSSKHLLIGGFVLLHALCCGLPLLLAAGMLGRFGGLSLWAGNGWLAALAAVAASGLLIWFLQRRRSEDRPAECCGHEGSLPASGDSGQQGSRPTGMVERELSR